MFSLRRMESFVFKKFIYIIRLFIIGIYYLYSVVKGLAEYFRFINNNWKKVFKFYFVKFRILYKN